MTTTHETKKREPTRTKGERAAALIQDCGPKELDRFAELIAEASDWQAKHLADSLTGRVAAKV